MFTRGGDGVNGLRRGLNRDSLNLTVHRN